ncbi:MAG: GNAT family N-acetyltransferase [Hyphomicrobium sp.]
MLRSGETYALPSDMSREAALAYWFAPQNDVFVATVGGVVAGSYYIRANQQGGGAHVANCGYVVDAKFAGCGVASRMCQHSLDFARERGFHAMQFNFVVASNEPAIRLWRKMGFDVVGRLPEAFKHPRLGLVDALVMFRTLGLSD